MTSKAIAIQQDQRPMRRMVAGLLTLLALTFALMLAQTTMAPAQERPATFADLAEQISPSVVNILSLIHI